MIRLRRICRTLHRLIGTPSRPPDFTIGPEDSPYMLRWWVTPRNRFFNIYLHHILQDDDDRALHDHPWWSLSFCLAGSLFEHYEKNDVARWRFIRPGAIVFRNGKMPHRLELISSEPAITVFITGPRFREWGFHCPQGWRHWRDFTVPGKPGQRGPGCD